MTDKKKPRAGRRRAGGSTATAYVGKQRRGPSYRKRKTSQLPINWKSALPDPAEYFEPRVEITGKANRAGWAPCRCPFHADENPSAGVNLVFGGFICHRCDFSADMPGFHQKHTGMSFVAAIRDLLKIARRGES